MSNNEASAVKITKNSSLKGLTTCTHTHMVTLQSSISSAVLEAVFKAVTITFTPDACIGFLPSYSVYIV